MFLNKNDKTVNVLILMVIRVPQAFYSDQFVCLSVHSSVHLYVQNHLFGAYIFSFCLNFAYTSPS